LVATLRHLAKIHELQHTYALIRSNSRWFSFPISLLL